MNVNEMPCGHESLTKYVKFRLEQKYSDDCVKTCRDQSNNNTQHAYFLINRVRALGTRATVCVALV